MAKRRGFREREKEKGGEGYLRVKMRQEYRV